MRYNLRPRKQAPRPPARRRTARRSAPRPPAQRRIDPLHILPPELMFMVADQLDPQQIFTLRRLSKGYNAFLQDERLVSAAIVPHETHDPADASPRNLQARFNAVKSHRIGKPAGLLTMSKRVWTKSATLPKLYGQYLTYATEEHLYVADLRSFQTIKLHAGAYLTDYAMTDEILAFSDYNYLACFDLRDLTAPKRLGWVPVGDIRAITAHGHHIAAYECGRHNGSTRLVIYDAIADRKVDVVTFNHTGLADPIYGVQILLTSTSCRLVTRVGSHHIPRHRDNDVPTVLLEVELNDYHYVRIALDWTPLESRAMAAMPGDFHFLPTGYGEHYLLGRDGMHYGILGDAWYPHPLTDVPEARWKGNSYRLLSDGDRSAIVVVGQDGMPKGALLAKQSLQEFEYHYLLANDSYLVVWKDTEYDVISFDGGRLREVDVPRMSSLRNTSWAWSQSLPRTTDAQWIPRG